MKSIEESDSNDDINEIINESQAIQPKKMTINIIIIDVYYWYQYNIDIEEDDWNDNNY